MENLELSTLQKEIRPLLPNTQCCSIWKSIPTSNLAPRNFLGYFQTTLIIGGRGIGLRIYVRYCGTLRKICYSIHRRSWTGYFSIYIKGNIDKRQLVKHPDRSIDQYLEKNFYEIKTYWQPSVWVKLKATVIKHRPEKSVK